MNHIINYIEDLGNPGQPPFTRGIYPNMYKGKMFTSRQITGLGRAKDTNERIKYLLANGETGISVVFDWPTIWGLESTNSLSEGEVGLAGVSIDSVEDMEELFKDIPIDKISVALVTHYPTNTSRLLPWYIQTADQRKIPWDKLRGSVQNDTTMECFVSKHAYTAPIKEIFELQCNNINFIVERLPLFTPITFNGYNLREAGVSGITEVSIAFSNALATLKMVKNPELVSKKLAFFWCIGSNFLWEVAKLRATRRLWYKLSKSKMKCHVQTSGISLRREEPLTNIVRSAYQALAAVLGGVQSLHVDAYDEVYSTPSKEAALIALKTQHIIQEETGVTEVADPLGGSYYIEELTNRIEREISSELEEITNIGGYLSAIESGWLDSKRENYIKQIKIREGEL